MNSISLSEYVHYITTSEIREPCFIFKITIPILFRNHEPFFFLGIMNFFIIFFLIEMRQISFGIMHPFGTRNLREGNLWTFGKTSNLEIRGNIPFYGNTHALKFDIAYQSCSKNRGSVLVLTFRKRKKNERKRIANIALSYVLVYELKWRRRKKSMEFSMDVMLRS